MKPSAINTALILMLFAIALSCGSTNQPMNNENKEFLVTNQTSSIDWIWWAREDTVARTPQEKAIDYFITRHGDMGLVDILCREFNITYQTDSCIIGREDFSKLFWFKRLKPGESLSIIVRDLPGEVKLEEFISRHLTIMDSTTLFQSHSVMRMYMGNEFSYRYDTVVVHANINASGDSYTNH